MLAAAVTLLPGSSMMWTDGVYTWFGPPECVAAGLLIGPDSPAIDTGAFIPGFHCQAPGPDSSGCVEWYGKAPDAGACEYVSGPTSDTIDRIRVSRVMSATTDQADAPTVIDDKPDTKWTVLAAPNSLIMDLGSVYQVGAVQYEEDWSPVDNCSIYVSDDGVNWGPAVYSGKLPNKAQLKFPAKKGRYLKFEATGLPAGYGYVTELLVFGSQGIVGKAPNAPTSVMLH
jgi:F5/8 type C domain